MIVIFGPGLIFRVFLCFFIIFIKIYLDIRNIWTTFIVSNIKKAIIMNETMVEYRRQMAVEQKSKSLNLDKLTASLLFIITLISIFTLIF